MVDIKIPETERRAIAEQYYDRLVKWIEDNKKWSKTGDAKANKMMGYIKKYRREFFLASPDYLKTKSEEFSHEFATEKAEYKKALEKKALEKKASKKNKSKKNKSKKNKSKTSYEKFVMRMREIYNGFMQSKDKDGVKNGYWLMKELDIKVCPYCNINYTTTINTRTIQVRPEYDHFFPEADYPSLILSFYNLVPSCPQCNHLKRTQKLDNNPWIKLARDKGPIFKVDTSTGDFPEEPVIIIDNENENIKKLGISELYNEHADYVKDILDKIQAYNPATYLAILNDFQGIVHTAADLDRMIWGNYIELSDSDKRPLAKLTADILEQYKKYL